MTGFGEWFSEQILNDYNPSSLYSKQNKEREYREKLKSVIDELSAFVKDADSDYYKRIVLDETSTTLALTFLKDYYEYKYGG